MDGSTRSASSIDVSAFYLVPYTDTPTSLRSDYLLTGRFVIIYLVILIPPFINALQRDVGTMFRLYSIFCSSTNLPPHCYHSILRFTPLLPKYNKKFRD